MSRYRSLSAYNQLLITHMMSKIIFMKYLPPVRPIMVPKLKHPEFIEIGHISYYEYPNLDFDVKIFFIKYLPIARPKLVPK